jgi:hypothetical protein
MSEQTQKRRRNMWVSIAAIAGIVILESVAMFNGINGTTLSLSLGLLGTAAGFTARSIFGK